MSKTLIFRISLAVAFVVALAIALPPADTVGIQFMGTGHPNINPERPRMQTGIVVDVAGDRWLLDAGAGTVARLYDHKKSPDTIKHIFISHLHYDHCVDLDAVLWQWRSIGSGPTRRRAQPAAASGQARPKPAQQAKPPRRQLTLWGPDGLEEMLSDLYNSAYKVDGRGRALLTTPAIRRNKNRDAGTFDAGAYKVTFREVVHAQMDCWAIRFETPRGVLVFSGDIGGPNHLKAEEHTDFMEFAAGADMLIIDTLHLPPEVLGEIAAAVKPKTMVFTHLAERPIGFAYYYDLDKTVSLAKKSAGKVVVAEEGMELEL